MSVRRRWVCCHGGSPNCPYCADDVAAEAAAEVERRLKIYSEVCKLCGWDYPETTATADDARYSGWPEGSNGHRCGGSFDICQAAALKRLHAERDKAAE